MSLRLMSRITAMKVNDCNLVGHAQSLNLSLDVAILHDIVSLAQELLPTLPERERLPTNALFRAYYDILPRLGLDTDHDNRFARILFKIGGLGGGPLRERFLEVIGKLGIEIAFDDGKCIHLIDVAYWTNSPVDSTVATSNSNHEQDAPGMIPIFCSAPHGANYQ